MALKLNTQASLWSNEMAGGQVANFSAYEGKIDAAILKEVQGVCRSPPRCCLPPCLLLRAAACCCELLPRAAAVAPARPHCLLSRFAACASRVDL